ncbi:MAG: 30S ribosomal protein S3 [Elusimicrobia bacterium]|nr:30S ribosomal protein S3 [Elusimicrobiota bacterium]
MGHKIHPKAVRLGYTKDWDSKWFSLRDTPALIGEDVSIRTFIEKRLATAAISRIVIERAGSYLRVNVHTARPGVVIGRKGTDIEYIREMLENMTGRKTFVSVVEVKQPDLEAQLVAQAIAFQLERRVSHRRAIKRALERCMSAGAKGVKIMVKGRLGGNEIARREWLREGRVPLHTFRADIDFGFAEANTTMGKIGVKVWIFRKEYFAKSREELIREAREAESAQATQVSAEAAQVPEAPSAPASTPEAVGETDSVAPEPGEAPAPTASPAEERPNDVADA